MEYTTLISHMLANREETGCAHIGYVEGMNAKTVTMYSDVDKSMAHNGDLGFLIAHYNDRT